MPLTFAFNQPTIGYSLGFLEIDHAVRQKV